MSSLDISLYGLDGSYTSIVTSDNVVPGTTLAELYDQLTAYNVREKMLSKTG
jgi:hypothetical protein